MSKQGKKCCVGCNRVLSPRKGYMEVPKGLLCGRCLQPLLNKIEASEKKAGLFTRVLNEELEKSERRYRVAIANMRRSLDDCEYQLEGKGSAPGYLTVVDELIRCQGTWEALGSLQYRIEAEGIER